MTLQKLQFLHKEYSDAEARFREQARQCLDNAIGNQGAAEAVARQIRELQLIQSTEPKGSVAPSVSTEERKPKPINHSRRPKAKL